MFDLRDRTILVTGATSGFGRAAARQLVALGARVVGTGRREDRLTALADELGPAFRPLAFDVTDAAATTAALARLDGPWARPWGLVNNAGLALGLRPAHEADLADWETMIATNCTALVRLTRAVIPGMVERGGGHVVNVGSVAGRYPYPGGNVYGATKAFVAQFSLNLRADLLGTDVRVTSVEPGLCETEFSLVRFHGDAVAAAAPYQGLTPLSAEDIADTIVWALTRPAHVNINRLEVMPVNQAFGPFRFHREG